MKISAACDKTSSREIRLIRENHSEGVANVPLRKQQLQQYVHTRGGHKVSLYERMNREKREREKREKSNRYMRANARLWK